MFATNLLSVSDSNTSLSSLLTKQMLKSSALTVGTAVGTQGVLLAGNSRTISMHLRDASTKASYVLSIPIGPTVGNTAWVGQVYSKVCVAQPVTGGLNTLIHDGYTVWKSSTVTGIVQNVLSTISGFSDIVGSPSPPYVLPITSSGTPASLTSPAMINFTATFTPSANPLLIEATFTLVELVNTVS